MRKERAKEDIAKMVKERKLIQFNMTLSIAPQTNQIFFDSKKEDIFEGGKLLRKRKLAEKDLASLDLEFQKRAECLRIKRFKAIGGE